MNHAKNFSLSSIAVIFLILFTFINPSTNLDLLASLTAGFIILQKILGEYFILVLLALRPTLDYWRDYNLFSIQSFNININAALSVFLLIWSIIFFVKNYEDFKKIPFKIAWLAFITWCAISSIYTYNLSSTIIEVLKLANLFGLFGIFYIMAQKNPSQFKQAFLRSALGAAIIPFTLGLYQFITKTGMDIDEISNRIYGTFAHPNVLATFTILLTMIALNEIVAKKYQSDPANKTSLLDFHIDTQLKVVTVLLLCIIALTYTRIVWIGTTVLFIFIGALYYKKALAYSLAALFIFYSLFYPINRYLINNYNINLQANSLVSRLTSRNQDSDSVRWRTNLASKILPLFKERLVLGYGYGTFARVWDDNKDIENLWDNTSEAHNDYIKVAFESGIIGLLLFLMLFANLLYAQISFALNNNWRNIIYIASICIYLTLSLSDNMLRHTPVIWWFWAVWGYWSFTYSKK